MKTRISWNDPIGKRERAWLKKYYATASWELMRKRLRGRTIGAIRVFANLAGLHRAPHERIYSKKEDKLLRKLYPRASWPEIQRALRRSKMSISQRARVLGVKRVAPEGKKFWSKSEVQYLRVHFPNAPREEIENKLQRNWNAICRKASDLGIRRFTEGHMPWSEKEDATLREKYPSAALEEIIKSLPGRGWHAIRLRAHTLQIRRNVKRESLEGILSMAPLSGELEDKFWEP